MFLWPSLQGKIIKMEVFTWSTLYDRKEKGEHQKHESGCKPYWWKEWAFVEITTAFQTVWHSQKTFNVLSTHSWSFHMHAYARHVVCIKSVAATSTEYEGCGFNVHALYTIHSSCFIINKRRATLAVRSLEVFMKFYTNHQLRPCNLL